MKRILLAIIAIFLLASPLWATTWYAQDGSGNMSTRNWNDASGGGGTPLVWALRSAGDVFVANAQTGIVVDVDPGVSGSAVTLSTATSGGGFTITTGTITVTANITGGTTDCLVITGGTVTIPGGVTITGGSANGADGIFVNGANITFNVGSSGNPVTLSGTGGAGSNNTIFLNYTSPSSATIYCTGTAGASNFGQVIQTAGANAGTVIINGNITGGSGGTAYGLIHAGSWNLTLNGNCIGGSGNSSHGCYNNSSTGILTVNGKCIGGSHIRNTGCYGDTTSTGYIDLVGSVENTPTSTGIWGKVKWTPGTLYSDFRYIKLWNGGTDYKYAAIVPNIEDVETGTTYGWDGSASYTGTLSGGAVGGGAWGF